MSHPNFGSAAALAILGCALAVACTDTAIDTGDSADTAGPSVEENIPGLVVASLNVQPTDTSDPVLGKQGRAFYILDVEAQALHFFPFTDMPDGAIEGQPMHAGISADMRTAWATLGGSATLPLRLVTMAVTWELGIPSVSVISELEMVAPNTGGNTANGNWAQEDGSPGVKQEGHGIRITGDGAFLTVTQLQNDSLRVFDVAAGTWAGDEVTHLTVQAPHGMYTNPSATYGAVPQYNTNLGQVSIWTFDPGTGAVAFDRSLPMVDGDVQGAVLHTVVWLDDQRFLTDATQEPTQGSGAFDASVWLVDLSDDSTTAIIGPDDLLQGVSDLTIAGTKLYLAEGNNNKYLGTGPGEADPANAPGYLSVWDITDVTSPEFVTRLGKGEAGMPDDLVNSHSLNSPSDGSVVFLEAFVSSALIQFDPVTDTVIRAYGSADGLSLSHGMYLQPQSN